MFRISPFFLAALLTGAAPAAMAAPASPVFPVAGVRMEILNLPSAPPGKMAVAPGGGFVTTPAILFNPTSGENIHGPAIVMIDAGPGSNPLRAGESTRFAAERWAAKGYTVLSLYTHLERGYSLFPLEATAPEIDSALAFLEQRGHEEFVLAGNGYGAIAAANYLATMKDEPLDTPGTKRVKAAIFFSPLTELRKYPGAALDGAGYEPMAKATAASMAGGGGGYPEGNTVEVGGRPDVKVDPWVGAGRYNGPPEQFVSYWSPAAAARNEKLLAALKVPTLVIGAGRDPTFSAVHLKAIKGAAPIETIVYPQAVAGFAGQADTASDDGAAFLAKQGLSVRPKVIETVIDVTTADGRSLPAVVYSPEAGADPAKPAYFFVHGRTGDTVQSSGHWVGWRLAQAGYVAIVPAFRVSGAAGFASSTMAEQADDMGRWIDVVAGMGYKRLIAVGHSNGGIYTSVYMSKTHDPRVIGVAFMAPTVNERERNIQSQGAAKIAANLAEAKAAIGRGEGLSHMIGYITSQTYWDLNNPNTVGTHTDRIKEYSVPTLSIIGRNDDLFHNTDFVERFIANQKPGMAKLIWLDQGSHGMRESKDVVAADIVAWTKATFGQ